MRKSQRFLAMLLTVVMCFAAVSPLMAFAEDATSRIVTMENFDGGSINTSSKVADVSAAGGFWFDDSREGGTYSLENGTLWYTCRRSQLIDIRFYHDTDAQRALLNQIKGQDFILSYRLKAHHDAMSMKSTFTEHYDVNGETKKVTDDASMLISDGTITSHANKSYTGEHGKTASTQANLGYEIYKGQWYLIEIAFLWDANATSHTGAIGAYTHANLMFNGEVIEKVKLEYAFNQIDAIRLGQDSVDECEIDDLTIATGRETLAGVDGRSFDPYTRRTHWIKAADKAPVTDYAYSFAIVGDTQKVSRIDAINIFENGNNGTYDINNGNRMDTIYEWIVNNVESKKIEYVMGLGDITEYGYGETLSAGNKYSDIEWANAVEAISKMNGVVPYSITRGNHDGLGNGVNKYFTDAYKNQFTANTNAAGFFGNQGVANSYRAVKIGQTDYLFVTLNYNPTDAVLEEAGEIIEQYPDHRVIITTHAYMYDNYTTISSEDYFSGYENNDGEGIWNKLIRKYENIYLVMSGHIASDKIQVSQVEGDHGNIVTQMLIDFQVTDAHFGYTGNVVMMYFSADGNEIQVETYSPLQEAYFLEENQFTLKFNPNTIYSNDFSTCKTEDIPNTGVGGSVIFALQNYGREVADGVLKLTESTTSSDCLMGFRPYQYPETKDLVYDKDVILSYKIKMDEKFSAGQFFCRDQSNKDVSQLFMKITNGDITVNDVAYGSLIIGDWNDVSVVFNYDEDVAAYTTYSIVLNGKLLGLFKFTSPFAKLNRFELFRYASNGKTFWIDDFYYGFKFGNPFLGEANKVLWSADFEEMTEVPTKASADTDYVRVMNGYLNTYDPAGNSKVANGILSMVSGGGQSFIDAKYGYDLGYADDLILRMVIRPIGTFSGDDLAYLNKYQLSNGSAASSSLFLLDTVGSTTQIMLKNGIKTVELSPYRFSTVEVMMDYDYAKMIYTSLSLYVNGEYVETIDITSADCASIGASGYFRSFYLAKTAKNAGRGYDIDSLAFVTGAESTYKGETSVTEFIGYQTTAVENGLFNLRLVSILTDADIAKYDHLGYNVTATFTYNGQPVSMTMPAEIGRCDKVFTSILATDEMAVAGEITAETLGGEYIFAVNCMGLPADCDITFDVTTYYQLAGQDTEVAERNFVFTVNSASNANQGGVN